MEEIFDDYIEPNAEAKAELIKELQEGNFTLSFSSLSAFAVSPREFIRYKLQERVTTPAMILGEAVHCLVLEPEKFNERFFIAPDVNAATKEGRAEWVDIYRCFAIRRKKSEVESYGQKIDSALQNDENADVREFQEKMYAALFEVQEMEVAISKIKKGEIVDAIYNTCNIRVIDAKVYANAEMRARQLISNKASAWVLSHIESTELKIETEIEGLKFRGVIDAKGEHAKIIADIKNVPDATWDKCQRSIWSRRLHWQAHIYDRAAGFGHQCYIMAVDGMGEVSVHGFAEHHLVKAAREIEEYITRFKECIFLSHTEPEIWDASQDFWLTTNFNPHGINYL